MHAHTQIRHAVVTALKADAALQALLTGDDGICRVWKSRAKPVRPERLPALAVYTPADKVTQGKDGAYGGDGQGPVECEMTLAVEIVDLADDDDEERLDDALDAMAERVEAVLDAFEDPSRRRDVYRYQRTESDLYEKAEHTFGSRVIVYSVKFQRGQIERHGDEEAAISSVTVTLDGSGFAILPAGIDAVLAVRVDGRPDLALDRGLDYLVHGAAGGGQALERLAEGMMPDRATLTVTYRLVAGPMIPNAGATAVYLGQAPDIGAGHADGYTRVWPPHEGAP